MYCIIYTSISLNTSLRQTNKAFVFIPFSASQNKNNTLHKQLHLIVRVTLIIRSNVISPWDLGGRRRRRRLSLAFSQSVAVIKKGTKPIMISSLDYILDLILFSFFRSIL